MYITEEQKLSLKQKILKSGLITCNICQSCDHKSMSIWTKCRKHSCSDCWEKSLEIGKCPYCNCEIKKKNVVKLEFFEEFRNILEKDDEEENKENQKLPCWENHSKISEFYCFDCDELLWKPCFSKDHKFQHQHYDFPAEWMSSVEYRRKCKCRISDIDLTVLTFKKIKEKWN